MFYFFYQQVPKTAWIPALASERANIIRTKKPALCSVLDVDSTFDDPQDTTPVKYIGPLYFDLDSDDLDTAIEQAKKLLTLIQSKGVDLNTLRCYLSGKKGVHVLMDQNTFMVKVPPTGTQNLPSIYKELVWSTLYVDDVDMRVFSEKKGRLLRCSNVERDDNGAYRVSVTAEEIFGMTKDRYKELCSAPRGEAPVEPAKFSPELALAFSVAQDKVTKKVSARKAKKSTSDALKPFNGEWPKILQDAVNGVGFKEEVGFNSIAMQLVLAAQALGKKEEQFLEDCAGLIESHQGDSSRYGTPGKRKTFLREMFRYLEQNPCYTFETAPIMALLTPEARAKSDLNLGDYVPDAPETITNPDGTVVEVEVVEEDESSPIRVSKNGIFTRTDSGYNRASSIGIGRAVALRKMDMTDIGYEVDVFKLDKPLGTHMLTMDKLASRAAFQTWTSQWSASMGASDIQTAKLMDILGARAQKNGDVTYIVTREGIDLIIPQDAKSEDDFEIIWSCPKKVVGSKGGNYKFRNSLDRHGAFQSDMMESQDLSLEDAELVDNLLKMNTTKNLAKMLGWFCVVPLTQIIRRFHKQFPILQVFGQSGAGKSKTTALLNHLWYNMKDPKQLQAQGTTPYALMNVVASSASQPVVFEEVKAREMSATLHHTLLNILRCNYDGLSIERGALNKDGASKDVVVNSYGNVGPIVFVGESVENQSALLERCIVVSLSKQDRYGKDHHYHYAKTRATELGRIGKAMASNVMAIDIRKMRTDLDEIFMGMKKEIGGKAEEFERPVFNLACVSLGLKLLADTLRTVFGERFDERITEMRASLTADSADSLPTNMAEASRVIDQMAQLSRSTDPVYQMIKGVDYTLSADGKTMDLKLRTAFAKYVKWQRSLGMEVLYDNENAFIAGMSAYAGTLRRACPDNDLLFDSPRAVIYRLNLEFLNKENVDTFRD